MLSAAALLSNAPSPGSRGSLASTVCDVSPSRSRTVLSNSKRLSRVSTRKGTTGAPEVGQATTLDPPAPVPPAPVALPPAPLAVDELPPVPLEDPPVFVPGPLEPDDPGVGEFEPPPPRLAREVVSPIFPVHADPAIARTREHLIVRGKIARAYFSIRTSSKFGCAGRLRHTAGVVVGAKRFRCRRKLKGALRPMRVFFQRAREKKRSGVAEGFR